MNALPQSMGRMENRNDYKKANVYYSNRNTDIIEV